MKFGYFDDANREYVITSPRTPYPWINYLGTQGFFSLISNTAGGYSPKDKFALILVGDLTQFIDANAGISRSFLQR